MIKKNLAAAVLLFCYFSAHAEVAVDGVIDKQQNWIPKNSPYIISGEVTIERTGFVTIYPGTTVRFKEGAKIMVKGALYSKGSPQNPVRFIPDDGTSFYEGIMFQSPYRNTIEYSIMIRGGIISEGTNVIINNNYILNSTGIQLRHLSVTQIRENYFFNNTYGIHADGKNMQMSVTNNTFNRNRFALYISNMPGAKAVFRNNNFRQNQANIANYSSADIDCKENYWGSADERAIARLIFDRKNNNKVGRVVFMPFAKQPFKLFEPPPGFMALVKQYLALKRPDEDPERVAFGASFMVKMPFTPERVVSETNLNLGGVASFTANITGAFLWGVEAGQFFSLTEKKENYDYSLSTAYILANLYYYLGWQKNIWLVPYLKMGNGVALITEEYSSEMPIFEGTYSKKHLEVNYAFTAGVGLEMFLTRNISLKLDVTYAIITARHGAINSGCASFGTMFYFDSPLFLNR